MTLDGYELAALIDLVAHKLGGELSAEGRAELEATKADLIADALERLDYLWSKVPDTDAARNAPELEEISELEAALALFEGE